MFPSPNVDKAKDVMINLSLNQKQMSTLRGFIWPDGTFVKLPDFITHEVCSVVTCTAFGCIDTNKGHCEPLAMELFQLIRVIDSKIFLHFASNNVPTNEQISMMYKLVVMSGLSDENIEYYLKDKKEKSILYKILKNK